MKEEKQQRISRLLADEQGLILMSEMESDLISQIKQEIENLPENCKLVFKLSYFEGYETTEIAEKLNISSKTVFNLRSMALKAIKTAIFKRGLLVNMIALILQTTKRF
jgi:RNA polymerase sigma-70 factor (ECF subfamily)